MTSETVSDGGRPDAIDRAAGLGDGSAFKARNFRPEFVDGAEACRVSVLHPDDDLGLSPALRAAIARRVALTSDNPALVAEYPVPNDAALAELSEGAMPEDRLLQAVARHSDLIASDPGSASAEDLHRLIEAGLTVPQMIALSELLAFVGFQCRVVHGLGLLGESK